MADVMLNAVRVERGRPGPEELAVITAVLLARIRHGGPDRSADADGRRATARWRRLERVNGFQGPRSWRTAS
ncbi:acyl-CoA carboxylase subunit epsilon [Streptomyces sp. NRRL B-24484]|uniref:acyl-CoA carboxylase subunit epsilon n=1 Tax=Streptomyces sp. NRRL B-24484 TaxID=1463833 RepID=UPI0004BE73CF|nr:acyl-CoA carboxylase subunit epsilon [Streptomyces sp. NRRL B-24484]